MRFSPIIYFLRTALFYLQKILFLKKIKMRDFAEKNPLCVENVFSDVFFILILRTNF
jgi:hypothetical protein